MRLSGVLTVPTVPMEMTEEIAGRFALLKTTRGQSKQHNRPAIGCS